MSKFWNWLFKKDLDKVLNQTKTVWIKGVKFTIKKVDVLDHVKGAQIMMQSYDVYKTSKEPAKIEQSDKKIKEHYSQVLVAGTVHPRLTFKDESKGVLVESLFVDWDIINGLYSEIMSLTYGKKKMKLSA